MTGKVEYVFKNAVGAKPPEDKQVVRTEITPRLFSRKVLPLIPNSDPMLHTPTAEFDFQNPQMDPNELFQQLKDSLEEYRGLGLSANQVGLPYSVFVYGNPNQPESITAVFNPKIVDLEGEQTYMDEGCLSYPGLIVKIKRFERVRLRFADVKGKVNTLIFEGLTSRVVQHECDHLEGMIFTERANKIHLERGRRQKERLDRLRKRNSVQQRTITRA